MSKTHASGSAGEEANSTADSSADSSTIRREEECVRANATKTVPEIMRVCNIDDRQRVIGILHTHNLPVNEPKLSEMPEPSTTTPATTPPSTPTLSDRESRVIRLGKKRWPVSEIASKCGITEAEVRRILRAHSIPIHQEPNIN
jgi:hypothetical protein